MSEATPPGIPSTDETILRTVRDRYGQIAQLSPPGGCASSCCGDGAGGSCCSPGTPCGVNEYSPEQIASLPEGAFLGLGCGNPTALLSLAAGETVLDLGSGGGIDCFLAAHQVGPTGHVVGVDMTPEMVARSRKTAREGGYSNVEFRLGEIEHLPVPDARVDVVLSNCVLNLSLDQDQVYREAFRVLRPGGRLLVSDMLATRPIPPEAREDPHRWSACSSGARTEEDVERALQSVGFSDIIITTARSSEVAPRSGAIDDLGVVPGTVSATKPTRG
ncbi:MAG TPA: arsenite methyltransferase [Thermoplasmata archaeon]